MMKRLCGIALLFFVAFQSLAQDDSRPKQPDLPGDLMIDYGFSYWSKKLDHLPVKVIGSNSVSIFYNRRFEINEKFSFHPGGGFSFEKYAFSGDNTWRFDNTTNKVGLDTLGGSGLTKNKLTTTYFEIPFELRYHPLGTVNGEGWFIGLGGIAGLRLASHTKVKYDEATGSIKEKVYDDFGLKAYRYGVQLRFGFRSIHFFYKVYLSDLFDSAPDLSGRMPRTSTIGINISGF
ncbi:MAG: outer membrane beta-barrel protein [Cyclobacteriaceae bacterium]